MFTNDALSKNACEELYDSGCKQGAIFRADTAQVGRNVLDSVSQDIALEQAVISDHPLVVITQNCDIVSVADPEIEALVCHTITDKSRLDSYDRNSARYFVVDRDRGLVACVWDRVRFDKRAIRQYSFASWPSGEKRFERFKRWLGRRYTRPAIPNDIVRWFCNPIEVYFRELQKSR